MRIGVLPVMVLIALVALVGKGLITLLERRLAAARQSDDAARRCATTREPLRLVAWAVAGALAS
jgi:hypothetical protein